MLPQQDQNRDSSNPVEQPTPPPIESAEAAGATKVYTAGEYWINERKHQEQVDNDARNDAALRTEMCRLIDHLSVVIDDHAAALAHAESDAGAFNMDIKKDLLTWQLAEFLTRCIIDRDPDEPPMTRGWQVDQEHAFDFFRVDALSDHSLVALEVEASRKS
jgi:hypothetical protein